MFAGCATKLYKLSTDTRGDVSQAGDYTVSNWIFIKWGSTRVIAIGDGDVPQYYDIGTSTDFADLTNAPTATCGAVVVRSIASFSVGAAAMLRRLHGT